MSTIVTSLSGVALIEVQPVSFQEAGGAHGLPPVMYVLQEVAFHMFDGSIFELTLQLDEGCTSLAAGDVVALPPVPADEGEAA